jgi:prevent-host-death family protein
VITVGLRELRQDASRLVRRAEAGELIEVTVQGRPAARLVPADGLELGASFLDAEEFLRRMAALPSLDREGWLAAARSLPDPWEAADPWARSQTN